MSPTPFFVSRWTQARRPLHRLIASSQHESLPFPVGRTPSLRCSTMADASVPVLSSRPMAATPQPANPQASTSGAGAMAGRLLLSWPLRKGAEEGVCTEFHGKRQTAALVPLPDGKSAVVWVLPGDRAATLQRGDPEELEAVFNQFAGGERGWLRIETAPRSWPESFLLARRITGGRIALAGEAAHALSPIGAQGLNLSLADAAALHSLGDRATKQDLDPGSDLLLSAYARRRKRDIAVRTAAVQAYAFAAGLPGTAPSRARFGAAQALDRLPALRKMLMRGAMRAS